MSHPKDANGFYILSERDDSYLPEVVGLYVLVMIVLALRFAVRLRAVGIRGLQWDDLFAGIVAISVTMDLWVAETVYPRGTNIEGVALEKIRPLTQPELDQLMEGSKYELVAWYSYPTLIWAVKATMICFFLRMTVGVARQRLVIWLGYFSIVSYVVVLFTITFGCWPYTNNFQIVPDPGITCTLKTQNFVVITIFNIITDAAILAIPVPLLWTLQVPLRQKLVIGMLLSSGVFVIAAAIIRISMTFSTAPSVLMVNRWGHRETVIAIIATNVPVLRPLFNRTFWTEMKLPSMSNSSKRHTAVMATGSNGGAQSQSPHGPYEMTPSVNSQSGQASGHDREQSFSGSEDFIINKDAGIVNTGPVGKSNHGVKSESNSSEVVVHTRYEVTEGPRASDEPQWHLEGYHNASVSGGKSPV